MGNEIKLTSTETAIWESDGTGAQRAMHVRVRARAQEMAKGSGRIVEIYSYDGIVLDAISPDLEPVDEDDSLYAVRSDDGWVVHDPRGGVWHPDTDAAAEIAACDDPALAAVQIADGQPTRGRWAS